LAVVARRALLVAELSCPTAFAEAFARHRIAGRVVLAVALMVALGSVESKWAVTLATDASVLNRLRAIKLGLAQALASDVVALKRFRAFANALEGAVLPGEPRITFLLATRTGPTWRAVAFAIYVVATAVVETVAGFGARFAVGVEVAGAITLQTIPARFAETLTGFRAAFGVVLAVATLRAVLTVGAVGAFLLALKSGETWNRNCLNHEKLRRDSTVLPDGH
jgi:hypothetical protein